MDLWLTLLNAFLASIRRKPQSSSRCDWVHICCIAWTPPLILAARPAHSWSVPQTVVACSPATSRSSFANSLLQVLPIPTGRTPGNFSRPSSLPFSSPQMAAHGGKLLDSHSAKAAMTFWSTLPKLSSQFFRDKECTPPDPTPLESLQATFLTVSPVMSTLM